MILLPDEDRALSPLTGWTREHWAAVADGMLLALRPYGSPARAFFRIPGPSSSAGRVSDGLEGFARSFLLAAMRVRGDEGADPHDLMGWYAEGVAAGTDPSSPEHWPTPTENGQSMVEAASIVLALQLSRPWLWARLEQSVREAVLRWLGTVVGRTYPDNNWVWFQIVVEAFLAAEGGPYSAGDVERDLALSEGLARQHGWYADGHGRAFDHYTTWAFHFLPLLCASLPGGELLIPAELVAAWRTRLDSFLEDHVHLIGADGMPLLQGRSLIYRFATAAPLWVGAWSGTDAVEPGLLRRAASGLLRRFVEGGALEPDGVLTVGLLREYPGMAQHYSGSGSPYWASFGMLGLALPARHPVWTAIEAPLPVELGGTARRIEAPGWTVSGTPADGVVRVINHGTDHAEPGELGPDNPMYARIGYSTASYPVLEEGPGATPDMSVFVRDASGAVSSRTGFSRLRAPEVPGAAASASRGRLSWAVSPEASVAGPEVRVVSLLRGAWEIRIVDVIDAASAGSVTLQLSGWPLPEGTTEDDGAAIGSRGLRSRIVAVRPADVSPSVTQTGSSPLAGTTAVPVVAVEARTGARVVVAVGFGELGAAPSVAVADGGVAVDWGDGSGSEIDAGWFARLVEE